MCLMLLIKQVIVMIAQEKREPTASQLHWCWLWLHPMKFWGTVWIATAVTGQWLKLLIIDLIILLLETEEILAS